MRVNELFEVSMGDYVRKAKISKALGQMGAAFAPDAEQRGRAKHVAQRREKGLARADQRKPKAAAVDHHARLPALRQRLEKLERRYDALGGDRWQYADRMMPQDIEARDIAKEISNLQQTIAGAQK